MTRELFWLTLTVILTGLLWVPYVLNRCQVRLKAGQRRSLQSNSSRAMNAALDVLQGRPLNYWKKYDSLVDSVTLGGLADFARKHLKASGRTQLVVRP